MRAFITTSLISLLFCFSAQAQTAGASGLKQNMKQIGSLFKAIGATVNDASHNVENAANATKMADLFKITYGQIPEVVADMPDSKKAAALADYQQMIQQEIDLSTQMHDAFVTNDNYAAARAYQGMKDLKQQGHDKYNP